MKIKDVKTWAVANPPPHHGGTYWVFLKLTTDNGIAGYGECFGVPFSPKRVCGLIEENSSTLCKYMCVCPIQGDERCQIGLLSWNRYKLPSSQPPGQICEALTP